MTVYLNGCAKCGTEDAGRFTDTDDVCLDCRSTQPDERSPCCHADIVWAAELVPGMGWHLVCSECQDIMGEVCPCEECDYIRTTVETHYAEDIDEDGE